MRDVLGPIDSVHTYSIALNISKVYCWDMGPFLPTVSDFSFRDTTLRPSGATSQFVAGKQVLVADVSPRILLVHLELVFGYASTSKRTILSQATTKTPL